MSTKNNPKSRDNELITQELKGELLIYDLKINKAYSLNPTSAIIWNLCDGKNSVSDITSQLSKKLKQPLTDDLVWLALDQFKEDNLLKDNETVEIKFDGLSRREVIRKVGFASMIALPVIASLIAPTAIDAQSGCRTLGQTCTSSTGTQQNCCTSSLRCLGPTCVNCRTAGATNVCSGAGCCSTNAVALACCNGSTETPQAGNPGSFVCTCN